MHEENFLSSWLREDVEGKTAEMEKVNKEAKEEKCNGGKREFEGEKERVAAVCKRACCEPHSGLKDLCDKKCNEEGFKFLDIAAISVEGDSKPHTINLCKNCHDHRLT